MAEDIYVTTAQIILHLEAERSGWSLRQIDADGISETLTISDSPEASFERSSGNALNNVCSLALSGINLKQELRSQWIAVSGS